MCTCVVRPQKFLIINVGFDVSALVKQIKSTCRGQAEKLVRKVELGMKALVTQPSVEIVHGKCEWKPKSLQLKSLQARHRQSK